MYPLPGQTKLSGFCLYTRLIRSSGYNLHADSFFVFASYQLYFSHHTTINRISKEKQHIFNTTTYGNGHRLIKHGTRRHLYPGSLSTNYSITGRWHKGKPSVKVSACSKVNSATSKERCKLCKILSTKESIQGGKKTRAAIFCKITTLA
jgi:hypothetical protein